jgi:glycine cleavage system regulatory protein
LCMQNEKNNTKALVSQINMVISQHGINFIDSRIEREWNEKAIALLNKIECNVKPTKTADNYIKKVKYDNFLILQFYLKKFSK